MHQPASPPPANKAWVASFDNNKRTAMQPTPLSEADAELIIKKLIEKMCDEQTVDRLTSVWGKYIDRLIGLGFRKVVWVVLAVFMTVGLTKMDTILMLFQRK